jgi:hypothetical protein
MFSPCTDFAKENRTLTTYKIRAERLIKEGKCNMQASPIETLNKSIFMMMLINCSRLQTQEALQIMAKLFRFDVNDSSKGFVLRWIKQLQPDKQGLQE